MMSRRSSSPSNVVRSLRGAAAEALRVGNASKALSCALESLRVSESSADDPGGMVAGKVCLFSRSEDIVTQASIYGGCIDT